MLSKVKLASCELLGLNYYKLVLKSLSNCYSEVFCNMIRRVLLTTTIGYSATEVKILNLSNEYSEIFGLKEDILILLLNIKNVIFKLNVKKKIFLSLKKIGKCIVKASDILTNDYVKILNPNYVICHLSYNSILDIVIKVEEGIGYIPFYSDRFYKKFSDLNGILLDACFCPIQNVSYFIKKYESSKNTDLVFFIKTNGSISAKKALKQSIGMFLYQLSNFNILNVKNFFILDNKSELNYNIFLPISEINLKIKKFQFLINMNIKYLGDLIRYSEDDLILNFNLNKNFIDLLKKKISLYNLSLGTSIDNWENLLINYLKK